MNGPTASPTRASDAGSAGTASLAAGSEILAVLVVAHVANRVFHQLTPLGRLDATSHHVVSLGATLWFVAVLFVWLAGRKLSACDLDPRGWWPGLRRGIAVASTATRIPGLILGLCLALHAVAAPLLGVFLHPFSNLAWLVGAGFLGALGEEAFFRGYVQSRLNEVLPRRWRWRGIAWGPGLLLTSALFGLLHAFNTVDYFAGRFTFAWSLAVGTAVGSLGYGLLREFTGSIVPGALLHFGTNMFWFIFLPEVTHAMVATP